MEQIEHELVDAFISIYKLQITDFLNIKNIRQIKIHFVGSGGANASMIVEILNRNVVRETFFFFFKCAARDNF